jgi:hypothetical protein
LTYEAETREGWTELHNAEFHDWRSFRNTFLENQIKEDKMGGTCGRHGGKEKIELVLWGNVKK